MVPHGIFFHPLVLQRKQEKLAKESLWPKCLWPKCHSGQSVTGQSVTLAKVSLAKKSPAKVTLAKVSLWPNCLWPKCPWPKGHSITERKHNDGLYVLTHKTVFENQNRNSSYLAMFISQVSSKLRDKHCQITRISILIFKHCFMGQYIELVIILLYSVLKRNFVSC